MGAQDDEDHPDRLPAVQESVLEPTAEEGHGAMILTFAELTPYRDQVSMVDGCFDPIHAGHVAHFHAAAALGRPLLCNLASDAYVRTKHPLLLPGWQRAIVIDALRDIALTHLNEYDTEAVLEQLRPYAYIKGSDWKDRLPSGQVELCGRLGIRIVFMETPRESSTLLLQDLHPSIV